VGAGVGAAVVVVTVVPVTVVAVTVVTVAVAVEVVTDVVVGQAATDSSSNVTCDIEPLRGNLSIKVLKYSEALFASLRRHS